MKASNRAGLRVPWAYLRRTVGQAWGVPPYVVDEAPIDEVLMELEILAMEADARKK